MSSSTKDGMPSTPDGWTAKRDGVLFRATARPVSLYARLDARDVETFAGVLAGWSFAEAPDADAEPHIELDAESDGVVHVKGRWVGHSYRVEDPADAACAFVGEALKAQANEFHDWFCVHAASVVIDGRAVVLAGGFRSGKSTLTAVLASRGITVIGDDVVFIDPASADAVATGAAIRLRRPYPTDLHRPARAFIQRCLGLAGKRYAFLNLPTGGQLANGETVPLGGVVFLTRQQDQPSGITNLQRSDALGLLIRQNFARQRPADDILASLSRLTAALPTLRLVYSDAEGGADLLLEAIRGRPRPEISFPDAPVVLPPEQSEEAAFRVNPDVSDEQVDDSHFIADSGTGRIFHLNLTGGAIWRMAAAGYAVKDIRRTLAEAFPDEDRALIAADVDRTISTFRKNGLLVDSEQLDKRCLPFFLSRAGAGVAPDRQASACGAQRTSGAARAVSVIDSRSAVRRPRNCPRRTVNSNRSPERWDGSAPFPASPR